MDSRGRALMDPPSHSSDPMGNNVIEDEVMLIPSRSVITFST